MIRKETPPLGTVADLFADRATDRRQRQRWFFIACIALFVGAVGFVIADFVRTYH